MTDQSILVTGSSGTIGTALCEELVSRGYDVTGCDREQNRWSSRIDDRTVLADLRVTEEVNRLPTDFMTVVHLAANARVHDLVKDPLQARDNFEMTFNVLEYVRRNEIPEFVFASSREVYGNEGKVIYSEPDTSIDESESPYTASKVGGEAMTRAYANCYDLHASILRFSNVYGRYDASNRVVPLFIAQTIQGQDLSVYGADKVLDFTYLNDCVDGIVRAVEKFEKSRGETFNIASGSGCSLVELAELIGERVDGEQDVHLKENRTGELSRFVADTSKAEQVLGYRPNYNLSDGLDATIEWYSNHSNLFGEIL